MRRALCVGIDSYPFGPLRGCVNDADRMASLLRQHEDGAPNFDCRLMRATTLGGPPGSVGYASGDKVGRPELRKAVKELFSQPAEVALLHFSGHGTVNDLDGFS